MGSTKTYRDALKQIETLKATAESLRKRELAGVVKRIREAIALYNIKASELYPTGKAPSVTKAKETPAPRSKQRRGGKPGPRPVKYADGKGNQWSGGGSTPVWLRNLIEAGHDREEFRVKK